jgi:hypothetical protein
MHTSCAKSPAICAWDGNARLDRFDHSADLVLQCSLVACGSVAMSTLFGPLPVYFRGEVDQDRFTGAVTYYNTAALPPR